MSLIRQCVRAGSGRRLGEQSQACRVNRIMIYIYIFKYLHIYYILLLYIITFMGTMIMSIYITTHKRTLSATDRIFGM